MRSATVGMQIGATTAPADIGEVAKEVEGLGYSEIWMAEDYFELGGIASVASALASTEEIPVGLGVVAAAARHPAATAMEFATLGDVHPGRFMAGLGHGSGGWVRQMGLQPASPLTQLREAVAAVHQLLAGDEVTRTGDHFTFDRIRLHHAPGDPVPIYLGVHGPESLRLSGELADGTLLGWLSSPGYVAWARRRIEEGRSRANRADHHTLVALCLLSVSEREPRATRQGFARWLAPMMAAMTKSPQLNSSKEGRELLSFMEQDPTTAAEAGPPDSLLGEFAAVGNLASCAATVDRLLDAGADRVVLVPNPAGYRSTSAMVEQFRIASELPRS